MISNDRTADLCYAGWIRWVRWEPFILARRIGTYLMGSLARRIGRLVGEVLPFRR